MKALSLDMILTSASTRADSSLGLRFSTPELSPAEKTTVFELLNRNLKVLIQPTDETPEAMVSVAKVLDFKTPSQRLRGVLFLEWKERKLDYSFDEFYAREMEHIIEGRKQRLEQTA